MGLYYNFCNGRSFLKTSVLTRLKKDLVDGAVTKALAHKLTIFMEIGEGDSTTLPLYNNTIFDPNVVGSDVYLAYIYRYSRAAVRRYKDRVQYYQTENELNESWLEGYVLFIGCFFLFAYNIFFQVSLASVASV